MKLEQTRVQDRKSYAELRHLVVFLAKNPESTSREILAALNITYCRLEVYFEYGKIARKDLRYVLGRGITKSDFHPYRECPVCGKPAFKRVGDGAKSNKFRCDPKFRGCGNIFLDRANNSGAAKCQQLRSYRTI